MGHNPIKELIEVYGWTPEQLAYKLGASFNSIKNWHRGLTKPIGVFQEKIARLYRQEREKRETL